MGVVIKEGTFYFANAKEILLFCNGSWYTQSPGAIETLLEIGYPPPQNQMVSRRHNGMGKRGINAHQKAIELQLF